jgi:hypothetical protein
MSGTGEHHSERGQLGSEDQKSYVLPHADFRSRANATMWLDLDHKTRGAHTGDVGIGRKPKT